MFTPQQAGPPSAGWIRMSSVERERCENSIRPLARAGQEHQHRNNLHRLDSSRPTLYHSIRAAAGPSDSRAIASLGYCSFSLNEPRPLYTAEQDGRALPCSVCDRTVRCDPRRPCASGSEPRSSVGRQPRAGRCRRTSVYRHLIERRYLPLLGQHRNEVAR